MSLRRRLGLARIYWKHCAAFHFAHKPLCAQYRADLLCVRGVWLCRSCTCLWLGIGCGVLGWWTWLAAIPPAALLPGYLGGLALAMLLSLPGCYKRLPRAARDVLRFSGGLCIALAPYIACRVHLWAGLGSIAAILLFRHCYLRSRLRRKLGECRDCPTLRDDSVTCDGFALQRARLSRYQEEATEYLYATGYVPPGLAK